MDTQHLQESNKGKLSRGQQRLKSIKYYLLENISGDLHANAVAKKFRLSVSSLHHFFHTYQQQSYRKYLEEIRINKAYKLLQSPGIRIKEVMFATGYKNRTTFNKAFKKKFTYPPGFFQK